MDEADGKLATFTFDPKAKAFYEYDDVSKTLIAYGSGVKGVPWTSWVIGFTDSGKIKTKAATEIGEEPYGTRTDLSEVIDLQSLTHKAEIRRVQEMPA